MESLEEDYKKRKPYIKYLTESRQSLLTIQAQLERMMERVERFVLMIVVFSYLLRYP